MKEVYNTARHIANRVFHVLVEAGEKSWEYRKKNVGNTFDSM